MSKSAFLAKVLIVCLMAIVPRTGIQAQEQQEQEPADAEEQRAEEDAAVEAALEKRNRFMEEVIVTAQKREESVKNVSATINAFTGQDLRDLEVGTALEISKLISNADIKTTSQGVNPNVTIRGVGMNNYNSNNNSVVGMYVNEVFLSSPAMLSLFMMDLERTEVLKGPQGTLYGRNTNGGAINIISAKPSQDKDIYARIGYGAYDTVRAEAVVNGGLSDAWSGRLSFLYDNQGESFQYNIATGDDMGSFENIGLRGQLRYDSGGRFTMNLGVSYLAQDGALGVSESYATGAGNPENPWAPCPEAAAALEAGGGADITQFPRGDCVNVVGDYDPDDDLFRDYRDPAFTDRLHLDTNVATGILNLTYDFPWATLTSITGYIGQDRLYGEGGSDAFFAEHDEEIWQVSQELRLGGGSDKISWIGGLFYSRDEINTFNPLQSGLFFGAFFGLNPLFWDYDQKTTSAAVFGSLDFYLSNTVTLVAGLRYTDEETSFVGGTSAMLAGGPLETTTDVFNASPELLGELSFPLTYIDDSISDGDTSGRVALEIRPNDNNLIYGSVSTGFKSGGYFGDFTIEMEELTPYDKETLVAYEIGAKSTMANGKVQLNGAVFYYDYDDIQTLVPGTIGFRFGNVEHAKVTGVDLELMTQPVAGLDILLGAGFLDTSIESQFDAYDGNELPNAPKYQFNGLIRYSFAASDKLWMAPLIGFKVSDAKWTEATNHPFNYAPGWSVFDVRFSIFPPNLKWEIAVFGQNITDERYFEEVFYADALQSVNTFPGPPNTWGLSLTYNF